MQTQKITIQDHIRKALKKRDFHEIEKSISFLLSNHADTYLTKITILKSLLLQGKKRQAMVLMDKYLKENELPSKYIFDVCTFLLEERQFSLAKQVIFEKIDIETLSSLEKYKTSALHIQLGNYQAAYKTALAALSSDPENIHLKIQLAELSVNIGNISDAKILYSELITQEDTPYKCHYDYSKLHRAKNYNHIEQMQKLIEHSEKNDNRIIFLHYAIAKELEELGQISESFRTLEYAGNVALASGNYSINIDLNLLRSIRSTFSMENFKCISSGKKSKKDHPIFILGLPRTGSTLVEKILSNHSTIESIGETFYFQVAFQLELNEPALQIPTETSIRNSINIEPKRISKKYLELTKHLRKNENCFIEKLPENFNYIGLILKAFPNATIIYTKRNILDVSMALFKQPFFRFAYNLDHLAKYLEAHMELLKHWHRIYPGKIIEVNYEDLVNETNATIEMLFNKIGMKAEPACFNPQENINPSATASAHQVKSKINKKSLNSSNKYIDFLPPQIKSLHW